MIDIIQSVLSFIVALGLLVTFHEFGHYWVAKKCDVKILRFSVGFGRPLFKRVFGKDETEFVIAALPLGGYVKMLDERETDIRADEKHREFCQKPLSQRFAIVAAGPAFNFIFAILAYWAVFIIGVNGLKPIVGDVSSGSIGATAGFIKGQEIVSVDNVATPTWMSVIDRLVNHTVNADKISLSVKDTYGVTQTLALDLSSIAIDDMAEGRLLDSIGLGIVRLNLPAQIGEVVKNGAAEKAGLMEGDKIIQVDNVQISNWSDWVTQVRSNPGVNLIVQIDRGGLEQFISITPEVLETDEGVIGRIGAVAKPASGKFDEYYTRESYPVFTSLIKAIEKTWDMSILTLKVLGKMLVGEASVKNLSGPITIAQYAGQSADIGIVAFLSFMAIVSVSLGVLNLLPVPLLDGGHLLYYIIEFISGKPVSDSMQIWGQQLGIVLLLGLMSIAFYNDLVRLFG
ncbi:MAG: RIP metalloprotease RseP [Pseudomonadota bacterium]